jgi:uncharacterized protein
MPSSPFRIVVDTNLWVSMALGSKTVTGQMQRLIEDPTIALFTSAEQLEELTATLAKPRLQKYLTQTRTRHLFDLIWLKTQLVHVTTQAQLCRDPNDDFVINLALDAQADCIITGDDDLLTLNPIGSLEILTLTAFIGRR